MSTKKHDYSNSTAQSYVMRFTLQHRPICNTMFSRPKDSGLCNQVGAIPGFWTVDWTMDWTIN